MNNYLHYIETLTLDNIDDKIKKNIISSLEEGKIIYLPNHSIELSPKDSNLLSESILDKNTKNISYDYKKNKLSGLNKATNMQDDMQELMHRYALFTRDLVSVLLPDYLPHLIWGRTSYRPAQINGRNSSKRKDDTLVHVDAFPSTPVNGLRIFRIFCNINPHGEPRVWHVGEPFPKVIKRFAKQLPKYSKIKAHILNLIQATKSKRSAYDHYMLHTHDSMKLDDKYQTDLLKKIVHFPPQSTWMVFTDQVSHAALSGQFLLEQTFYLPVEVMDNPSSSPFKQLEAAGII